MKDRVKTKVIGVPNEHKKLWKPSTLQQTVSYFTKLHHCAWGTRYWNELAIVAQGLKSTIHIWYEMKSICWNNACFRSFVNQNKTPCQKVHFASLHVTEIQDSEMNWLFFHKVKVYDTYLVWKKILYSEIKCLFQVICKSK